LLVNEYERAYKLLNKQQRQAVEQIDGPVLVIAGPGTGKTQLLSTRVGYILANTDTLPQSILCLTFTNKAAINMKQRIIRLAPKEGARVAARTFHSFAAEIMNSYPDSFWNAAKLSVAPESVQLDIIESIVAELPLDNPLALKFAGQYTLLADIQRAINLAKDAGLTPEKLRALAQVNLAYIDGIEETLADICAPRLSVKALQPLRAKVEALPVQPIDEAVFPITSLSGVINTSLDIALSLDEPTNKTGHTGAWKKRWIQTVDGARGMFDERRRNGWWLELANVYEKYRDRIHQRGFYDYADMLIEVITQLEQNPEMLADVQERYNYVMIDEFQDTNPAQMRLAHLVSTHFSDNGNPNLMAVGDDDQSIFKFNGAELNNMLGFERQYVKARTIVLTENYRSTQAVLDCAKRVIEQAEVRLVNSRPGLSKELLAAAPPAAGTIRAIAYSSRELQLSLTARDIAKNHNPGREIAVLARGHDSLKKMAGLLQSLSVPVRYEQASNVLDHEVIDLVYKIITLAVAIKTGDKNAVNGLVHQIIRAPMWRIEGRVLWELAEANYKDPAWLDSLLGSEDASLAAAGQFFLRIAGDSNNQPLAITIEQVLGLRPAGDFTSPIKSFFESEHTKDTNNYFHALSAIQLLRSLVHEFSAQSEPGIEDFARFIEINKANGKVVADESPFISGEGAVQLLSVHKAKGLEFDHVYIIDAVEDNWKPRSGARKPPANLPLQPNGDDADDYVRLMYVALTRARSSLSISAYYQDSVGKDVAISPIIQSAFEIERTGESDKQKLIEVLEENLRWPSLSGGLEKEMLKARLETYKLSVTHLLNFLDVTKGGPQYFKERNLLRLPEAKTISLSFGTAMHDALDTAQRLTNQDRFNLDEIKAVFSASLKDEQVLETDYIRYQAKGSQLLERLFGEYGYSLPKGSKSEHNITDVRVGRAVLSGKLDRVDTLGDNKLRVIDYKTGSALGSLFTADKNKAIKAYKHKLQLIFYALLLSELGAGKIGAIESQMVYLEAESPKNLTLPYVPTPEDVAHLKRLIDAVWDRITSFNLPDTSGYPQNISGIRAFERDLLE
jgi:DNA helicase-2/ATP-dependent DNA helicase PcrA